MMHDWTLEHIHFDWKAARAVFECSWREPKHFVAEGVTRLQVPREEPWGPSVSIYSVIGPTALADGLFELVIEMQSGDEIRITARSFVLPEE